MPIMTVTDGTDARPIEMYLHQRFTALPRPLFLPHGGLSMGTSLARGRGEWDLQHHFRFTGCGLVHQGGNNLRLLPADLGVVVLRAPAPLAVAPGGQLAPKRVLTEAQAQCQHVHDTFIDPLSAVGAAMASTPLHLLVKVALIGLPQRIHMHDRRKRLSVILVDHSCPQGVELVLWDNQILLAALIQKGDMLAIQYPYLPLHISTLGLSTIEYGSATVIYCLPRDGVGLAAAASAAQDDEDQLCTQAGPSLRALRDERVRTKEKT